MRLDIDWDEKGQIRLLMKPFLRKWKVIGKFRKVGENEEGRILMISVKGLDW